MNPGSIHRAAAVFFVAHGLPHLVGAWGDWRARAWPSWLGCSAVWIDLPFEAHAVAAHPDACLPQCRRATRS
ncbi:DUF2127 domain-containing protein [Luteimonas vadosa]|uniref:DUF2127 domain-containing protein n=1 Tax=Luteimonas vadosa TaxID=1165507 RepID=UPI003CD078BC